MKLIPLTQGKSAMVDDEDFEWLSQHKWQYHYGYAKTGMKTLRMHRLILDAKINEEVDHINRNKLDNRRENLRIATRSQNNHNVGIRKDNTSGHKGVNFFKPRNKWMARIQLENKRFLLGYYATKDEAILAYEKAETAYKT